MVVPFYLLVLYGSEFFSMWIYTCFVRTSAMATWAVVESLVVVRLRCLGFGTNVGVARLPGCESDCGIGGGALEKPDRKAVGLLLQAHFPSRAISPINQVSLLVPTKPRQIEGQK